MKGETPSPSPPFVTVGGKEPQAVADVAGMKNRPIEAPNQEKFASVGGADVNLKTVPAAPTTSR